MPVPVQGDGDSAEPEDTQLWEEGQGPPKKKRVVAVGETRKFVKKEPFWKGVINKSRWAKKT